MFSQPNFKKMNMMPNMNGVTMPMINNMNPYSQNEFMSQCDNMSYISNGSYSTQTSAGNYVSKIRGQLKEEINASIGKALDIVIPKITEECSQFIFASLNSEMEPHINIVEDLKVQLENFEKELDDKIRSSKNFNKKDKRKLNENFKEITEIIQDQRNLFQSKNEEKDDFIETLRTKLLSLEDLMESDQKENQKNSQSLKDQYIEMLNVKNLIDERINQLSNEMKINRYNLIGCDSEMTQKTSQISNYFTDCSETSNERRQINNNLINNYQLSYFTHQIQDYSYDQPISVQSKEFTPKPSSRKRKCFDSFNF